MLTTVAASLIVSACSLTPVIKPTICPSCVKDKPAEVVEKPAAPAWVPSDFSALPGWGKTDHAAYLTSFTEQCSATSNALAKRKTTPAALLDICRKARQNMSVSGNALPATQIWMEANFDVWQFQQEDGNKTGLLTGYYEPMLKGARKANGKYNTPLYGVPKDLITVKLDGLFPELAGKRVRGRLQDDTLVPFFDRQEWERIGPDREEPLVWVDDKLDAFLLQVQGSGRIELENGEVIRLGYADQNGHPYKAIGGALVQQGRLTKEEATIPGIRAWAKKNPKKLDALLNENPSVVFFKENKVLRAEDGPIGAMGVPLTGKLSLAVDRQLVPYGSMLWIDSTHPQTREAIHQGALAQDTGGAIRGRIRADYYWGTGNAAGEAAGLTKQPLRMWLIWPKGAVLPNAGAGPIN